MKKLLMLLGTVLFLAATSVPGFAEGKITLEGAKLPRVIGMATSGVGGSGQAQAVALASAMQDALGVPVRTMPAHAPAINLRQILAGNAQIQAGGCSQETIADAIMGTDIYANQDWGPQDVGVIWYMYDAPSALMVRGDSKIKGFEDLKGKKLAIYYAAPAYVRGIQGCLAFGNLGLDDMALVEVGSYSDCVKAVGDGRADVAFAFGHSPVTYEVAENPRGIRFLAMPHENKEAWDRYFSHCPFRDKMIGRLCVPQMEGLEVANTPFVMWTHMNVDEDLVYLMTKVIVERYDSYKDQHPTFVYVSLDRMREFMRTGLAIPIHPGAVRYLKEIGEWNEADEAWNNRMRAGHEKRAQAWDAALDEALPKKIAAKYDNKQWLAIWDKHRQGAPAIGRRDMD